MSRYKATLSVEIEADSEEEAQDHLAFILEDEGIPATIQAIRRARGNPLSSIDFDEDEESDFLNTGILGE